MILQALTAHFEDLIARGEIARPGWNPARIGYALSLDENGMLLQVVPTQVETLVKNKTVVSPQTMTLPAIGTRTGKVVKSGFLWDNASYLLGIDEEQYTQRAIDRFENCKELHHKLLDSVAHPVAQAILKFFDGWNPKEAVDCAELCNHWDSLLKGSNLVFRVNGAFAQDIAELAHAWDAYYNNVAEGEKSQCLISGQYEIPESTHPLIKGVAGAQPSGAAIVSFNAPAFCSYGKEQSHNAPVGKYAAFAYTAALNHLLADRENVHKIGDTTVVCWAEGAEPEYNAFSNYFIYGGMAPEKITSEDLKSIVAKLAKGLPCEEMNFDFERRFYILGLSPNAARLSVRFFYNSTFGELMKNVAAHHQRLAIRENRFQIVSLKDMIEATEKGKKDERHENTSIDKDKKKENNALMGAVVRSIFSDSRYPIALIQTVVMRIRSDQDEIKDGKRIERKLTDVRAAIIKAYYLKNKNEFCPEEVLTVGLNEASTNVPYTLGRLFAVYEELQEAACPTLNTTIKDTYFNSAASTPAHIYPRLDKLAQNHMRTLTEKQRIYFDKQIGKLKNVLCETNPVRLNLPEQGSFYLGYYHQKKYRYSKKED